VAANCAATSGGSKVAYGRWSSAGFSQRMLSAAAAPAASRVGDPGQEDPSSSLARRLCRQKKA